MNILNDMTMDGKIGILWGNQEAIMEDIKELSQQIQAEHIAILAGIGMLLIVGIAILINQRKIKKQLKKLLEEKDKP